MQSHDVGVLVCPLSSAPMAGVGMCRTHPISNFAGSETKTTPMDHRSAAADAYAAEPEPEGLATVPRDVAASPVAMISSTTARDKKLRVVEGTMAALPLPMVCMGVAHAAVR